MHSSFWTFSLIFVIVAGMAALPASAAVTLTGDDSKFLSDLTNEGIPLLFMIPATLKAGIYHGDETAISGIAQEQTAALDAFVTKINGYTLSDEVKKVRDQYLTSADVVKKDLSTYSTLIPSCGSCFTKMDEMYPRLTDEAKKFNKQAIAFFQSSAASVA